MNYRMVVFVLGRIFLVEAAMLLLPMACSAIYGEWYMLPAFLLPAVILLLLGLAASLRTPKNTTIYARDGLAIVALVWVLMSAFGALPFVISGEIPAFADAFFEMVSGFTTTGSTILNDVEALSRGALFWRSFSHWVGGMGVLVFAMAVLPMTDGRAMHLMRAEVPGPTCGKLSSKLSDSAKILYGIYFAMTALEVVFLCAGGMSLYESLIHSFGTAGTGGFSNRGLSIGAYQNPYFEWVIGIFMLLFGVNFNLYYFILMRHFREAFGSEELRAYLGIVLFSTVTIAANILSMVGSVGEAVRTAFFQVSSIITTTGYATADFDLWPQLSRTLLTALMLVGASAGSTGGGLKVVRMQLLVKSGIREIRHTVHPKSVNTIKMDGRTVSDSVLNGAQSFFFMYILVLIVSVLLISFDGYDLETNLTAVLSALSNIGPGFNLVGPTRNFSIFSDFSTFVLSMDMLIGRLEIFPMLMLAAPSAWRQY